MATQLQIRRGTTAQMNAFTGAEGELAVNTSTDTVHVHDGATAGGFALAKADGSNIGTYAGSFTTLAASGAVTLSSTLAVTGEITANGGIALGDSDKATFGASDDLQIYHHSGGNSIIAETGTGDLFVQATNIQLEDASGNNMIVANSGGAVNLYHNAGAKLVTTATGIDVTGTATMGAMNVTSGLASGTGIGAGGANGNLRLYANGAQVVTVATTGSVGIGTSSPSSFYSGARQLVVGSGSGEQGITVYGGNADTSYLLFADGTSGAELYAGQVNYSHANNSLNFITNGITTPRMTLDASGNLLVGKTATAFNTNGVELRPNGAVWATVTGQGAASFNIKGTDGVIADFYKDGAPVGSIGSVLNGTEMYLAGSGANTSGIFFSGANSLLSMKAGTLANGTQDLGAGSYRFKDLYLSGEVIAGAGANNNPSITSHVDTDTGLFFGGGNILGFSTGGAERMRIDSSGNLLVGTTSTNPTFGFRFLPLAGDSYAEISHDSGSPSGTSFAIFRYNQSAIGSIGQHGTSAVLYNTTSDERAKENIADSDDAGSKIDAIQVRQYDWKADGSHQDYGMIAQELLEVAPEAVHQPEDSEEMMGVDYSKLVPMLVKEIQSLRTRVQELENN